MPVIPLLLWAAAAHAGTAVWLEGAPDPALTPGDTARVPDQVAPAPVFGEADQAAFERLRSELAACRPLLDEFDGELTILRRIEAALAPVEVLRGGDVEPVWHALLLQGLAVHRYFPDPTSPEAASAGAVGMLGSRPENGPWLDAIALMGERLPTEAELPDANARLAYQELRARVLLEAPAALSVANMPAAATLIADGKPVSGSEARLLPGHHRLAVVVDGQIHMRMRLDVAPAASQSVAYPAVASELVALAPALREAKAAVPLSPAVQATLARVEGPVSLVVMGRHGPRRFLVDQGLAAPAPRSASEKSENGPQMTVLGGVGWVYDGDYLLQNAAAGAPETAATVNAGAGVLGLGATLPLGPLHAGAGVDLVLPLGDHHTLPSGDRSLRLRAHPHAALGWGPVQATVGWWSPWHLAAGARATLPLGGRWGLTGAYIQGIGLDRDRDDGSTFSPAASRAGFVAARWAWGG